MAQSKNESTTKKNLLTIRGVEIQKSLVDHCNSLDTKSARVRYLASKGFECKQIHKVLDMLYQHVYNVLHQRTKANP